MRELENSGWHKHQNNDGSTTYTMDDYTLIQKMKENSSPENKRAIDNATKSSLQERSYGINSFKVTPSGKFTLKMNKTVTQAIAAGGASGAGVLVSAIPGLGWSIAGTVASTMAGVFTGSAIKNGVVIKGRLPNKINSWHWQ